VLKSLQCENVGVYLIDGNGNIEALGIVDENNNEWIMPIPIKAFFVGDKTHGGIDAPDANIIQWSFAPNYSDYIKIFTIDTFNVLSDLCGGSVPPTPPEPKKAYIPDVASVRDYVTNTTTACVFGKKSAHSTAGFTLSGYVDGENLIEIWENGNNKMFLSDADIYAPDSCANMFYGCAALQSLDLSNFNTENVTTMMYMFQHCTVLQSLDLSNFNTGKVENMREMFYGCAALRTLYLTNFNTENVRVMYGMFRDCTALLTIAIPNFNTEKVTTMMYMFKECTSLITIYGGDWIKSQSLVSTGMFDNCTHLIGGNGTHFNSYYTDATYARIDRAGTPGYFTQA
jgi:surface protein